MRKFITCLFGFWTVLSLQAQSLSDVTEREREQLQTEYSSTANPFYWKNRKPFPGYWQQDVHYRIQADIDELKDIVTAKEVLTYTNNSPDTLHWVFFHLYQNAFQPGSYCDMLHRANDYPVQYGPYEAQKLGTVVSNLQVNGRTVKTELENTLLKVYLDTPLLPHASVEFSMDFQTYFDYRGNVRRRMKEFGAYGYKHFDGVHWYPRMAVYDRKFGWNTDQHLGKEFYGDFGTYEVELTFSADYVVEATGALANRAEVLPDSLRKKLDIENFAAKPWEEKPSVITPYIRGMRKTWKYRAINVHDFAWTADPTYRIGERFWNGIRIVALVQEPHASRWQNAAEYTAKIIETYSRDFGMYAYNKMVVADARDGMEYPMLTLDGGADPGYRGLLAHEVGHNWFFGMVGSNETYRAFMDEGFTQFLTAWALEKIDGPFVIKGKYANAYTEKHTLPEEPRYARAYYGYLRDAVKGDETTLNTHSDDFDGALRHGGGYGQVYYKTATMLFNLQYVLGDSLFSAAMKHYFDQFKIAHPYPEDFRNSIIQFTHADLNWFFDQWLETAKTIDYKVGKIKHLGEGKYRISLERKGEMQMPIDLAVYDIAGKRYDYYIPNGWFEKQTTAKVLPRWIGWGKLNPVYVAEVQLNDRIADVVIDTSNRLADINMLNNRSNTPRTIRLDSRVSNVPDWKNYEVFVRPDLWYNFYDGMKLGIHLNGNYMENRHQFEFSFWLNSGLGKVERNFQYKFNGYNPISVNASYSTSTHRFVKRSKLITQARFLDGLLLGRLGWEWKNPSEKSTFYTFAKAMVRKDSTDLNYLIDRSGWNPDQVNLTWNAGMKHRYEYRRGNGQLHLGIKTTAPGSDYDYSQVFMDALNENYLGKLVFRTRLFAQYGSGTNVAPESALYLSGANPEQMMENKYVRSAAFFPQDFGGFANTTNHFHFGGGLNVRGYSGYLAPETLSDGSVRFSYRGNSGISFNSELEFDELFPIRPRKTRRWLDIDMYFFADAGIISLTQGKEAPTWGTLRASAGNGLALTIKSWGRFAEEKPLTLRFDVPWFLNRTPDVSPDYLQFRWLVGVDRAF
jgi:aminopeptidase N